MPLPWLIISAASAAAASAAATVSRTTTEERVFELDIDQTKNLISTLQNLKKNGSINCALSIESDGLGIGDELEKQLEDLPILSTQEVIDKLTPHLNKAIKPLKKEVKEMVTMKKSLF